MKTESYRFETHATIHFAGEELRQLRDLSRQHYDLRCRAASEQGGFLYGWINQYRFADADGSHVERGDGVAIECSFGQLDMLAKIAEGENGYAVAGGVPIPGDLGKQIAEAMRLLSAAERGVSKP